MTWFQVGTEWPDYQNQCLLNVLGISLIQEGPLSLKNSIQKQYVNNFQN